MAPMCDEDNYGAEEHFEYVSIVPSVYGKTMAKFVATVGDNKYTNNAFYRRFGPSLVGCYSHRYNLAIKHFLSEHRDVLLNVRN